MSLRATIVALAVTGPRATLAARRLLAVAAALIACVCAACAPWAPPAHAGGPGRVACHIDYGGETQVVRADAGVSPYDVLPVPVGSYFLFRVVVQRPPGEPSAVRVSVFAAMDGGPVPLHEARFVDTGAGDRSARHGFTGLQAVYEPVRDGELQYWCAREPGNDGEAAVERPATPGADRMRAAPAGPAVRLVLAGDLMLDDGPGRTVAAGGDPLAAFDALLRDADFRVANLECPIASTGEPLANKLFTFRADPRVVEVLRGRFDAVSVANNHSGDQGQEAFTETLDRLKAAGIAVFGGGRNLREAHAPLWIERGGLRIALLGYDEFKPRSFEAGPDWPGVAWSDDGEVVADIRAARAAGADLVIPFMHWGWELKTAPSERQQALARRMIDAGADAVVGSHPHVTQGASLYRDRPIVWSLGNFVFDGFPPGAGRTGWLLRLTLDRHGVRAWDTVAADIDAAGSPRPMAGVQTPCGRRGVATVLQCEALAP